MTHFTTITLAELLLRRYETSAAEYEDRHQYKCRRCGSVVGWDNGTDDLSGLCDDCWVVVNKWRNRVLADDLEPAPTNLTACLHEVAPSIDFIEAYTTCEQGDLLRADQLSGLGHAPRQP